VVEINKTPAPAISLKTYLQNCRAAGVQPITEADPILEYAEKIGISRKLIKLCWLVFKRDYLLGDKRYKDWPKVFGNCVRGNWKSIWYIGEDGQVTLTSKGRQAEIEFKEFLHDN
jgi:hypothetical protein